MADKLAFEACGKVLKSKIITTSENKLTFIIKNKSLVPIRKVHVDNCLIKDPYTRCDYLFEIKVPCTEVIYLELKGQDIAKAVKQFESTMQICSQRHRGLQKSCHVVANRIPKIATKQQNIQKKFKNKHGILLHPHTTQATITID